MEFRLCVRWDAICDPKQGQAKYEAQWQVPLSRIVMFPTFAKRWRLQHCWHLGLDHAHFQSSRIARQRRSQLHHRAKHHKLRTKDERTIRLLVEYRCALQQNQQARNWSPIAHGWLQPLPSIPCFRAVKTSLFWWYQKPAIRSSRRKGCRRPLRRRGLFRLRNFQRLGKYWRL